MTTATLRPNATATLTGSVVGGAGSAHASTNDDSDTTYALCSYLDLNFGTQSIGTGVTKQIRLRWRGREDSSTSLCRVSLLDGDGDTIDEYDENPLSSITTHTRPYVAVTMTQAEIDGVRMTWFPYDTNDIRVMEAYVDLVYVTIPVVAVDTVSPDPYTASTTVPISWVNTLDSDGGGQTRYEIKVFTDAQYGAGGFDPDTSTPYFETGQVVTNPGPFGIGATTDTEVGPLENGDTYRAYVRVAQTVNGALHWSDWDYDEFTMNVTTSEIDTVTVGPDNANARMQIDLLWDTGTEPWNFVEIQRSIDGGTTWVDVRGATYVAAISGNSDFQAFDYESPNGGNAIYRARATRIVSTLPIAGSWVESGIAAWASDDTWLKAPDDSTLNVALCMSERTPYQRNRRAGVLPVLGRANPVVITDVRSSRSGTLVVETDTDTEAADLAALLDGSSVVLVQFPASMDIADKYIAVLSDEELFLSQVADVVWRQWSLEYVEVDAPADPDAGR